MSNLEASSGSASEHYEPALETFSSFRSLRNRASGFWIKDQETLKNLPLESAPIYSVSLSKNSRVLSLSMTRHFIFTNEYVCYKKRENSKKILGAAPINFLAVEILPNRLGYELSYEGRKSKIFAKSEEEFEMIQRILAKECFFKSSFEKCYNFESRLQKGGFGDVWRVTRKKDGKAFAAKIIPKCYLESTMKEINVLRMLHGHPNIISLEQVHETENNIILLLELIEGGTVKSLLKKNGPFNRDDQWKFLRVLLNTVKQIQSKGFVHRDVKPDNIMLRKEEDIESLVLIDFGLCFQIGSSPRKCVGTAGYIAPEVLNKEPYDEKVDVYSCGAVFFFISTGEKLFKGVNINEIASHHRNVGLFYYRVLLYMRNMDEERNLVLKMLAVSPQDRISLDEALKCENFL